MWGGNALKAAWHGATDAARNGVAAVATGAEKVGAAVVHGVEVAKDATVDAARWAERETKAAATFVAQKGQEAVDAAKKSAQAAGKALSAAAQQFSKAVKSAAKGVACEAVSLGSALLAPEVRRPPPPKDLSEAQKQLAKHLKAKQMAGYAADVYNEKPGPGVNRVAGNGAKPPGLENSVFVDPKSGLKAALYKKDEGTYVLAFAGTEDGQDWRTNFAQGVGLESDQYNQAVQLAKDVKTWAADRGATVECAGHSLGGGLAATAAMANGLPATTFNMARPSTSSMERYGIDPDEAGKSVDHYYVEGEVLTGAQEHAAAALQGAGLAMGGPAGAAASAVGAYTDYQIGTAVGNQESLPAVDVNHNPVDYQQASIVDRHMMNDSNNSNYVKYGLDKQIENDQLAISAMGGSVR